jgi:hypothetical protein
LPTNHNGDVPNGYAQWAHTPLSKVMVWSDSDFSNPDFSDPSWSGIQF